MLLLKSLMNVIGDPTITSECLITIRPKQIGSSMKRVKLYPRICSRRILFIEKTWKYFSERLGRIF